MKEGFKTIARNIACRLKKINKKWNGQKSILEMKTAGYNQWKQMEWIGWYFQFLCEKYLNNLIIIPGKKYGNVIFDGFKNFPWDFKTHVEKDQYDNEQTVIIINDKVAIDNAIKEYGYIGLVIAVGYAQWDNEERTFQKWIEELKGGKSEYEEKRIERDAPSRLRKVSFNLKDILFVKISNRELGKLIIHRQGRNSNGNMRMPKYALDLKNINSFEHYSYSDIC